MPTLDENPAFALSQQFTL